MLILLSVVPHSARCALGVKLQRLAPAPMIPTITIAQPAGQKALSSNSAVRHAVMLSAHTPTHIHTHMRMHIACAVLPSTHIARLSSLVRMSLPHCVQKRRSALNRPRRSLQALPHVRLRRPTLIRSTRRSRRRTPSTRTSRRLPSLRRRW